MRSKLQNLADQIRETQDIIDAATVRLQDLEKIYEGAQDAERAAKVNLAQQEVSLMALEDKMDTLLKSLQEIASGG